MSVGCPSLTKDTPLSGLTHVMLNYSGQITFCVSLDVLIAHVARYALSIVSFCGLDSTMAKFFARNCVSEVWTNALMCVTSDVIEFRHLFRFRSEGKLIVLTAKTNLSLRLCLHLPKKGSGNQISISLLIISSLI